MKQCNGSSGGHLVNTGFLTNLQGGVPKMAAELEPSCAAIFLKY